MSIFKVLFLFLPLIVFAQSKERPEAKLFDSYVFAMSYMNDFCNSHPTKIECKTRLDHPEMVLHGLWPNLHGDARHAYQYCSISQEEFGKNWCNSSFDVSSKMEANDFTSLSEVMPGVQSCLYNHEWYAHGTCSGMSVKEYFKMATGLAKVFRSLPHFKSFLKGNYGKEVSHDDLMNALKEDLGSEAMSSIALQCRHGKKAASTSVSYLSELQITLDVKNINQFPNAKSFSESENNDTCPRYNIQIPVSSEAPIEKPSSNVNVGMKVKNPCPCATNPGKSYCHSAYFSRNEDGSITNEKDDGSTKIVSGNYSSVEEFISKNVCK